MKKLLLFGLLLVSGASMYAMKTEGNNQDFYYDKNIDFHNKVHAFIKFAKKYDTKKNFGMGGFEALKKLKNFWEDEGNDCRFLAGFEFEEEKESAIETVEALCEMVSREIKNADDLASQTRKTAGELLEPYSNLVEHVDTLVNEKNTKKDKPKQSLLPEKKQSSSQPIFTKKRMFIGCGTVGAVVVIMGSSYGIYRYVKNTHAKGEDTIFDRLFAKVGLKKKRTLEIA